eukprot:CAMPEP_0197674268 /NCGR_PEP_ID=MMETSP1338-20131121/82558_1 /TAXON_ID=43686 ORGANISM="Pelagodinium beii, Strain RCC1491" /NCGR_SAMPLE_ID=MMETSP1338 /ASSEMBLY_ACC=CAM_ASM_000754 /LENGTH=727 /DNA_ID=CAMNT_0043254639 /DNA_START=14 /DNA_END=2193 /DNA_ORIENTATION=-
MAVARLLVNLRQGPDSVTAFSNREVDESSSVPRKSSSYTSPLKRRSVSRFDLETSESSTATAQGNQLTVPTPVRTGSQIVRKSAHWLRNLGRGSDRVNPFSAREDTESSSVPKTSLSDTSSLKRTESEKRSVSKKLTRFDLEPSVALLLPTGTGSQIVRRSGSVADFADYYQVKSIVADSLKMVTSNESIDDLLARAILKHERSNQEVEREVDMFRILDHHNISKLFEVFEDPLQIHFLMEGCDMTLAKALRDEDFSERDSASTMQKILRAVNFMHDKRISHRALQPDVIMIGIRGHGIRDYKLQVGDLQHAHLVQEDCKMKGMVGHVLYSCPQMLLGERYTQLCDVWSCGALLHHMLCDVAPFEHENAEAKHPSSTDEDVFWEQLASAELPTELWKKVSSVGKAILRSMLAEKEASRFAVSECLKSKWLESFSSSLASDICLTVQHLESMQAFCAMDKLQKLGLQIIARRMPDATLQPFRAVFETIDTANDGVLDASELDAALKKLRSQSQSQSWRAQKALASLPTAEDFMKALDTNGNGELDMTEFVAAAVPRKLYGGLATGVLQASFNALDSDNSGEISFKEFEQVLLDLGCSTEAEREELKQLLEDADTSGNGELDFAEFTAMMMRTSEHLMSPRSPTSPPSWPTSPRSPASVFTSPWSPSSRRSSATSRDSGEVGGWSSLSPPISPPRRHSDEFWETFRSHPKRDLGSQSSARPLPLAWSNP